MSYVVRQLPHRRAILVVEYYSDAKLSVDFEAFAKRLEGASFDHLCSVKVVGQKRVFRRGMRARKAHREEVLVEAMV